jgi:hypothetical protein
LHCWRSVTLTEAWQLQVVDTCIAMIKRTQRRQDAHAKRPRGEPQAQHSSVERLLESGPREDRVAGACDKSELLTFEFVLCQVARCQFVSQRKN